MISPKKIIVFVLWIASVNYMYGQSTNQYIISPITFLHSNEVSIDLVSSETINSTAYSISNIITQGFLQPENFLFLKVENLESSFFRFYPNPASNGIFIEFKKECGKKMVCSIFNYLGQEVKLIELNIDYKNKVFINLSDLQNGVYLLKLYDVERGQSFSSKLIKRT